LRKCQAGEVNGQPIGKGYVETYHGHYIKPARGNCDYCHREVVLEYDENECDCGAIYSSTGSRFAPREQWGAETGESYADIVAPGDPFDGGW
jgi:hypothetical protein